MPNRQQKIQQSRAEQEHHEQLQMMQMPIVKPDAAGIDVGDSSHWVCVGHTPDGSDCVREFPAHTAGLRQLVQWLQFCGITSVALEASGVYGHVLFLHLSEARLEVIMTSPKFTKQIQGRPKTDKRDCQWIQRLHSLGFLPKVFQPDEATQTLRDYVRQRSNLVRLSGQHIQRMQKALILMNLKLTLVVGDITGVTGLKIIRAIVAGERNAAVLAKLRDRRCQKTQAEIAQALDGRYRPEHLLELQLSLQLWESYQAAIAQVDLAINDHLKPHRQERLPALPPKPRVRGKKPHDPGFDVREALYRMVGVDLTQIEGLDEIHALTLISELGTDFSKWPTVKHFASWLGLCPNFNKTGGKVKSSKTRKGKNRAAHALRLGAFSLIRSKSYLGAYLRRQRTRLGAQKAVTAAAHKLARIVYAMMRYGVAYVKRSEAEFTEEQREKQELNLQKKARALGYKVVKIEEPSESVEPASTAV